MIEWDWKGSSEPEIEGGTAIYTSIDGHSFTIELPSFAVGHQLAQFMHNAYRAEKREALGEALRKIEKTVTDLRNGS